MADSKDSKLSKFKRLISNSTMLDIDQQEQFRQIPSSYFQSILEHNFENNLELSRNVLFNKLDNISYKDLENEVSKIKNFKESISQIIKYIDSGKKVLFVTDIDNDGSLSQAIILEFKRLLPEKSKNIEILYTQNIKGNSERGFTLELLEKWSEENNISKDENFLMVSADNGINSRNEQNRIIENFSSCNLLITDHHLPEESISVQENSRTLIFNPKYQPTDYFSQNKNISGAHTLGVLLKDVFKNYKTDYTNNDLYTLDTLCHVSNMLDYVRSDIRFKPLEKHIIDKFNGLGPLLNINISISNLITNDVPDNFFDKLQKIIPDADINNVVDLIVQIKEQNINASKLLKLHGKHEEVLKCIELYNSDPEKYEEYAFYTAYDDEIFYDDYAESLLQNDYRYEHFNNNYIEQLRPYIFHNSVNPNISSYQSALTEQMTSVYSNISSIEKSLIKELRKGDLMNIVKEDNVTIIYPKDKEITDVFNRRFFFKLYNEENTGFLAVLNKFEDGQISGSFRGLHKAKSFALAAKKASDIELEFRGHDLAAGVFLKKEGIKESDIVPFSKFLQKVINKLNSEHTDTNQYIQIDFSNFDIIKKINERIRANVNNMKSIDPIIKLNKSLSFMEKETLKNLSVGQMLKKSKYGYTTIDLNFHGDTIIVSTETLREMAKNNFKDFLQLKYMSEGAFISTSIVKADKVSPKNIIKLESPKAKEQEETIKYYKENFVDNKTFSMNLDREVLAKSEIFMRSFKGEKEFNQVEDLILKTLDHYDLDEYIVCDTEANGLGKAPKLFNFGNLEISEDKNSKDKEVYTKEEWDNMIKDPIQNTVLRKKIKNIKFDDKNNLVIINRSIKATLISALLTDNDFKILQPIQSLTGITQSMVNKFGTKTAVFDKYITERYKNKKVLIQAHNSNYDIGVLISSLPRFKNEIIDNNLLCDSAKFSKEERLAYTDMTVANVGGITSKCLFYDNDIVDYSFSKYLEKDEDFNFPDIRSEYLFQRKNGEYFLFNRKDDSLTKIDKTKDELLSMIKRKDIPLNMVKYSVVALAKVDAIRSMLTYNSENKKNLIQSPDNIIDLDSQMGTNLSKLFQEYLTGYSFDLSPVKNMRMFENALRYDRRTDDLELINEIIDEVKISPRKKQNIYAYNLFIDGADEFLEKNKELYTKHHSVWEYQTLLDNFDPTRKVISKDQIEGLSYKTGFDENKIKEMLNVILDFKNELSKKFPDFDFTKFYIEELHRNFDEKGDVCLEGTLTLKRLILQNLNNYSNNNLEAFHLLKNVIESTTYRNIVRKITEEEYQKIAINSFSSKQYKSFSNRTDDEGNKHVANIIDIAKNIKDLYFQLSVDIIPNRSHLVAEKTPDNFVNNQEMIDLSSEKIKLLTMFEIFKRSNKTVNSKENKAKVKKMNTEEKESFYNELIDNSDDVTLEILKNIKGVISDIEKDLNKKFKSVSFSRESANIKDFSDNLWETISGSMGVSTFISKNYKHLDPKNNEILKSLIDNVVLTAGLLKIEVDEDVVKEIKKFVKELPKLNQKGIDKTLDVVKLKPNKLLASKNGQNIVRLFLNESLKLENELNNDNKLSSRLVNSKNPLLERSLCSNDELTIKEKKHTKK